MNEFDQFFNSNMSSKQITMLFLRLSDTVKGDNQKYKKLNEAHMRAWRTATQRENEDFDKALKEGYLMCAN